MPPHATYTRKTSMRAILPAAVAAATLGVLTWQVACGPDNNYVSESQFAAEYAAALCSSLQPCCSENAVQYDYASCQAGWQKAVENILYGPTSTGDYNPTTGTNCVQLVRDAQGAGCQPVPGSLSAARATCQAVFAGNIPVGGPCTTAADCAPMDGATLTCEVPAGGGEAGTGGGELPLFAPGVALQGLTVNPEGVAVCTVAAAAGGTPGASADGGGPPCTIHADAGTDTCATGTYCDPKALTCMAYQAAGGGCDPAVVGSCQAGNYCAAAGGGAGACTAAGPIGTPCTSSAMCDATGYCDTTNTHACVAIGMPTAKCTSGVQCTIGVCDPTTNECLTNAIATTAACTGAVAGQ